MDSVLGVVFIFFFWFLTDQFYLFWYSRKCGYDCSRCGYWPCPYHHCKRKRGGD